MFTSDLIDTINDSVATHIASNMQEAYPEAFGLDNRCARTMFFDDYCIAVLKHHDRNLQYYGGFEYVDQQYRVEIGNYVFYMGEDERVADHLVTVREKGGVVVCS